MIPRIALLAVCSGCTLEVSLGSSAPSNELSEVALVPTSASNDVDILFVIDDSPDTFGVQTALQQAFPAFLQGLAGATVLPSMHIGVVSTDLGTSSTQQVAAATIGAGPGSCSGTGKNGLLQNPGTPTILVNGTFIEDEGPPDARVMNYSGSLVEAFASISSLGSGGCGFEQPLEAARRALENTDNTGFLRDGAKLAVITVATEDDCSLEDASLLGPDTGRLGPLQSFRCTRFGVTCDEGGRTPDEMAQPGAKSSCRAGGSQYLADVTTTARAVQATKADARDVFFGAIAGVHGRSLEVAMETAPGGGSVYIPTLQPACTWSGEYGTEIVPAIRIADHASAYRRSYIQQACGTDMTAPMAGIGREIRALLGDSCLTRSIAPGAYCEAWDTRADGSETRLPACSPAYGECFELVDDPSCGVSGRRLQVRRVTPPPTDTMVSVRCQI